MSHTGLWEILGSLPSELLRDFGWLLLGLPSGVFVVLGFLRTPRLSGLLMILAATLFSVAVFKPYWDNNALFSWHVGVFVGQFLIGLAVTVLSIRQSSGFMQRVRAEWVRRSPLAREVRTDIRTVHEFLPQAQEPYDPTEFFVGQDQLFLGLSASGKPVHIQQDLWRKSHVDIVGMTGSGKGILAGVLLSQATNQGEAVIVVDPKHDEYAPRVMERAARMAAVPWYELDMGADKPQWNPLFGKSADEIEELLVASFGLSERGSDSDFYRVGDRAAARACAQMYDGESLPVLLASIRREKEFQKATKFIADMEEISSVPAVRTEHGLDLTQAIAEGAIIYVRGATRHPRVLKLQKMFVLSIIQHCERREREGARHVCLFLDELRYLITPPVLEALAAIRDKNVHLVVAHQTINDLRNVSADIDPEQVISSVTENCGLKFTYRVNDPDTALWLARMSGSILTDEETRSLETDVLLTEREREIRNLRQAERYLVDTNMLQSLPPRCAVSYGNGLADFIFTSPVPINGSGS